ncbi:hypothetical protein BGZ63DRAFT_210510 [Mariannaea sp. PMI_226]|nr:hypothetical protein BGZ63DRAFT_210510 [Mariannaea sp. PMI_226]
MSMYHSPMQLDEPAAQGSHSYSQSESWPGYTAQDYEPMQTEHRYGGDHHAYRLDQSSNHFGYGRGDSEAGENYHHHPWPQRRNSDEGPRDGPSHSSEGTAATPASSMDDYWVYSKTSESSSDRAVCHCGKVFRRHSDLAKHQKYHIKYFSCLFSGCEKAFATQKDLTRHARTHRKGEGYRCMVEGCRKAATGHIYSRKDNYDRHMRTAHPNL